MPKKKTKKSIKSKYDWPSLKQEFFLSEHVETSAFFRSKFGATPEESGQLSLKSRGWSEEKKKWKAEMAEMALAKFKEAQSTEVADALSDLVRQVAVEVRGGNVRQYKAFKAFWEILRTEAGLPTKITHNTNRNSEIDDAQALDALNGKLNEDDTPEDIDGGESEESV